MRVINIDELEWFQVKFQGRDEYCILIRKPHINDLDWFEIEPVRHGQWLEAEKGVFPKYCGKCSECGAVRDKENYCPNCGAKMRLEK